MDNLTEVFDQLGLGNEKNLSKWFNDGEKIIMSCNIYKFNDYKKRQERNLLITTHAIYNLKDTIIKRKIDMSEIKALTISTLGIEFVIHIPDGWDRIIVSIVKSYNKRVKIQIPCYFVEEYLFHYATINRMPTEVAKPINIVILRRELLLFGHVKSSREVNFDDFNVLKKLGGGYYGATFLVEAKSTGEWFAMKFIESKAVSKKVQIEYIKTEKMILEHVNHPYLNNLVYAFSDPSRLFVVMQFMDGSKLSELLRVSSRFEEKRAKFYAAQVSLGLGHLHSKNIIYRDLKIENILMDDFGNVCLSDFNLNRDMEDKYSMPFCGYPLYLSPEVILGQGYHQTSDWWQLGIFIYEMMFGLPPFYNKQQNTMFKLIKEAVLNFPEKPAVSVEAKDFITKCLNRDRRMRLGAKSDLQEIMTHPWFKDIDWTALLNKQLPTPFTPVVSGDAWIDHFNKDFTTMSNNLTLIDNFFNLKLNQLFLKQLFLQIEPMFDEQGINVSKNVSENGYDPFDNF